MRHLTLVALSPLSLGAWGCGGSSDGRAPDIVTTTPPPPGPSAATLNSISPLSAKAGSSDVILTVKGSGFDDARLHASVMGWAPIPGGAHCCNTWLDTRFISDTELAVVIPADLLRAPITRWVFVETGDPQGITDGVSYPPSNSLSLTVTP